MAQQGTILLEKNGITKKWVVSSDTAGEYRKISSCLKRVNIFLFSICCTVRYYKNRMPFLFLYIQLTLEQHRFELCRSTQTCIFSIVNATVLHDQGLVESPPRRGGTIHTESQHMWIFNTLMAATTTSHIVQGSVVGGSSPQNYEKYFRLTCLLMHCCIFFNC